MTALYRCWIVVLLPLLMLAACGNDATDRERPRPSDPPARPAALAEERPVDSLLVQAVEQAVTADLPDYARERSVIEEALPRFYEQRGYEPAWTTYSGPTPQAEALLEALRAADDDGLHAADYRLDPIQDQIDAVFAGQRADPEALASLDVLLTTAFMDFAADLHGGRVDPDRMTAKWEADPKEKDYAAVLRSALEQGDVAGALRAMAPPHDAYHRLRDALQTYRTLAEEGGWPEIPAGDVVRPGDVSPRVPPLRRRLAAAGYLDTRAAEAQDSLYDDALAAAVYRFQQHHALATDSLLGPNTAEALNVPVEDRIRQIELSLERWRWLPADLGERYVMVNIPGFRLYAVEDGAVAQKMNVVVGKSYGGRATPVFTDEMEHLIFSPYWNIPPSIANEEILPKARGNRAYLVENNFQIVSHYGPGAEVYDPYSTPLSRVESGELRLREKPGPSNALGLVKFMFPNDMAIYLHDTPADHLFDESERDYSHGCIRVERPEDLAVWALSRKAGWDRARIQDALQNGEWEQVDLDEHIPVYILYFTAFAEDDGTVRFYDDLYDHDADLADAL